MKFFSIILQIPDQLKENRKIPRFLEVPHIMFIMCTSDKPCTIFLLHLSYCFRPLFSFLLSLCILIYPYVAQMVMCPNSSLQPSAGPKCCSWSAAGTRNRALWERLETFLPPSEADSEYHWSARLPFRIGINQ